MKLRKSYQQVVACNLPHQYLIAAMCGFNILELLLACMLLVVLTLSVTAGFTHFSQRNKTAMVVNQLVTAINLSRATAIVQDAIVTFCGSHDHQHCDGQWDQGQMIALGSEQRVIHVYSALRNGDRLFWRSSLGENNELKWASTGFTQGQVGSFYYCPWYQSSIYGAIIVVSLSGRTRVDYNAAKLEHQCE